MDAGRLVAELFGFYSRFHRDYYPWKGSPIHDPCAVAHLIDPSLFETRHCGVRIDTGIESRGRTNVDRWGYMDWEPNCHVAVDIDAERFLELMVERVGGLG